MSKIRRLRLAIPVVAILLVASSALVATAQTRRTARPSSSPYSVVVSTKADRSGPVALNGAVLTDAAYVFVKGDRIRSVDFWIDDPTRAGLPLRTELVDPFDLGGGAPDGRAIAQPFTRGSHTVTVRVNQRNVRTVTTVTFTVGTASSPTTTSDPTHGPTTTAPRTTVAPVTTAAPTTTAPRTTVAPVTTAAPTTTAPRTTVAPVTTAPTTTTPPTSGFVLRTAANTGVPAGTTLTASGGITVTKAGTVIDGLDVKGCIVVQANDVTIRRTRVTGSCYHVIEFRGYEGYRNLLIEDVEVDGKGTSDNCISHGGYTARRVNLHGCADGAKISNGTVFEDSYIHSLMNGGGCHCDGLQSMGGDGMTVRRNNIDVAGGNAAIMLGNEFGDLRNITIEGNRLNGGNFILFGGANQSTGYQPTTMSVTNNRFGSSFTYGTHAYVASTATWSGNIRESNGASLNR